MCTNYSVIILYLCVKDYSNDINGLSYVYFCAGDLSLDNYEKSKQQHPNPKKREKLKKKRILNKKKYLEKHYIIVYDKHKHKWFN